ncbi:DUF5980 family protein [Streptomyces sp. RFCAC02]|uniref:DUF5980 family protein n=1 Tax=Streptomyces sp. RFCAC02 TaxID=2499143 RepID=UPI00101F5ADB|nr:DUF5980 family protein [Streptomyces sp. RFCAC02]
MRSPRRAAGILAGLAATSALALFGATPASAATWTLVDYPGYPQRLCLPPESSWPGAYFLTPIHGTWSTVIETGVRNLPPGSSSSGGMVHPSEWDPDDHEYIGMVPVSLAPAPAGDYIAELWASDGTETQTIPVVISYQYDCY